MKDNKLNDFRQQIDAIDDQILTLLAARFKLVTIIGKEKKQHNIPVIQKDRINHIIKKAGIIAQKNNLDPKYFKKIYDLIIKMACDIETDL